MSESQKPVTKSYRDNWDAIWGKPKCLKCNDTGIYEVRSMGGVERTYCSCSIGQECLYAQEGISSS